MLADYARNKYCIEIPKLVSSCLSASSLSFSFSLPSHCTSALPAQRWKAPTREPWFVSDLDPEARIFKTSVYLLFLALASLPVSEVSSLAANLFSMVSDTMWNSQYTL